MLASLCVRIVCFALAGLSPTLGALASCWTDPDPWIQSNPNPDPDAPSGQSDDPFIPDLPPPGSRDASMAQIVSICFGQVWEPNRFALLALPDDEQGRAYLIDSQSPTESVGVATVYVASSTPLPALSAPMAASPAEFVQGASFSIESLHITGPHGDVWVSSLNFNLTVNGFVLDTTTGRSSGLDSASVIQVSMLAPVTVEANQPAAERAASNLVMSSTAMPNPLAQQDPSSQQSSSSSAGGPVWGGASGGNGGQGGSGAGGAGGSGGSGTGQQNQALCVAGCNATHAAALAAAFGPYAANVAKAVADRHTNFVQCLATLGIGEGTTVGFLITRGALTVFTGGLLLFGGLLIAVGVCGALAQDTYLDIKAFYDRAYVLTQRAANAARVQCLIGCGLYFP